MHSWQRIKNGMREWSGIAWASGFLLLMFMGVSFLFYAETRKNIILDLDDRLFIGAASIKNLLPKDFHDQATGPDAVSPQSDGHNIVALSRFANEVDFKFLYTLIKKGEKIYITSSSATKEELANNEQVRYYSLFHEADPNFHEAFQNNTPVSFTHEDRWGTFRAFVLPEKSPEGKNYLSVAEYDISYLNSKVKSKLIVALLSSVLLVFGSLPLFFTFLQRVQRLAKKHENAERQLHEAQKMESVGRLAGGVAHDYNNMLSIIVGYCELALEKVGKSDALHHDLMEILTAARRSADITKQLLTFARKQAIAPRVVDVNDKIESMLRMLRRLIGENIKLNWHPGAEIQPVKIDPSQLDQIIANLCINARDAIEDVGEINIETRNMGCCKEYCTEKSGIAPGEYVMIAISDDGGGIAPDKMDKIFEPFFTTKSVGKGTGLGLAIVYGIVKQNNGFINVYSEPEKGTTINVCLPGFVGDAEKTDSTDDAMIPTGRNESVLLVEDDSSILRLGERMLKDLGYDVLSFNGPIDAIQWAKEHDGNIHLLITDVVMPEMNGRELSKILKEIYPNLKTLFMSGYPANTLAQHDAIEDSAVFISKPLSKKDLGRKVQKLLNKDKTLN